MTIVYLVVDATGYPIAAFNTKAKADAYAAHRKDWRVMRVFVE